MSQLVCRPQSGSVDHVAQKPKITVLVAVQNEEAHLRECLQGLMEQTIADAVEVIVIDRSSQGSEWAIVADLQRRHHNLTAIRTAPIGTCAAWNLGGKIASGSYLIALEATDRLRGDALEVLAAALDENPDVMLAYGDTCFSTIPHETFERHTSFGKMIWPEYTVQQLSQISLVAPHLMWRREAHDSIGWFDEKEEAAPLRSFLLQVVQSFRMLHIEKFLGLKLVPSDSRLSHPAPAQEGAAIPLPFSEVAAQAVEHPPLAAAKAQEPRPQVQEARGADVSAEEAYLRVQTALKEGDEEGAVQGLQRLLESFPDHAVAHNDLAALHYRGGNVEEALHHYEAAVRLAPEESVFRKNLADLYFVEAGRTDEAIAIYLKLLQESPADVETLLNLGIISESIDHPREAESFYLRGLEIEPWNPVLRERVGALRSGASEEEPEQQESVEERYARAQGMVAQGSLAQAAAELEMLVKNFPDCAPAHNDLAVLSYREGDLEKAQAHYEKAAQLAPHNSTFQKNLADFYFVEGKDTDGAIAIYLEELRKEPRDVETLMSLGRICTVLERSEEARVFYDRVLQLEPWNIDARESLRLVA